MAEVSVRQLCKSYGETAVIHGIDVDIADGEFVVLVGPSGCGKSTLLRMIAGLEEITSGDVTIGDRRVNNLSPSQRDIAMVFQSYALYPHKTVEANMGFSLKLRKMDKAEIKRQVAEAAEILGLTLYLKRYPRALSGGQRQRVAMGRAIVRNPQVFLFDEPLSNLDAKLRVQMRTEIRELHQRLKTTTVYVTHDQIEAMTMADKIVVLNGGHVEQIGSPLELYDRPKNTFVASFIGSPSMNLLSGEVTAINAALPRSPWPARRLTSLHQAGLQQARRYRSECGQNIWSLHPRGFPPRSEWLSQPDRRSMLFCNQSRRRSQLFFASVMICRRERPSTSRLLWIRYTSSTAQAATGSTDPCGAFNKRHAATKPGRIETC